MFISGNALIGSMLFWGLIVYFFNFKSKFLECGPRFGVLFNIIIVVILIIIVSKGISNNFS